MVIKIAPGEASPRSPAVPASGSRQRTMQPSTTGNFGPDPTGNASGIATAAAGNRALARVATDTATVATHEAFAHPGLLHTQADFDRIARKI